MNECNLLCYDCNLFSMNVIWYKTITGKCYIKNNEVELHNDITETIKLSCIIVKHNLYYKLFTAIRLKSA